MNPINSGALIILLLVAFAACQDGAQNKKDVAKTGTEQTSGEADWRASGISVEFEVLEMGCNMCRTKVEETIAGFEGVIDIDVSLEEERATFIYNPETTAPEKIADAIREAGYKVNHP